MRRALGVAVFLAVLALAVACGGESITVEPATQSPSPSPTPTEEPVTQSPTATDAAWKKLVVDLTLNARRSGRTISFSGKTNLPDGAVISYQANTMLDSPTIWGEDGTVKVKDDKYKGSVSGAPSEPIEVWVAFQIVEGLTPAQPQELIDRFGSNGENMLGKNVVDFDVAEGRRAEVIVTVK